MIEYFPRQSNAANWAFTDQLCGEDGGPLWTDIPGDLVVTYTLVDRLGASALKVGSDDGTGQVRLEANGMMFLNVTPENLGTASAGLYDVREKIVVDGFTNERVCGRLPIYEGTK